MTVMSFRACLYHLKLFVVCGVAMVVWAGSARAATYDAVADFSISNGNPNGVWSYLVNGSLFTNTYLVNGNATDPTWSNNLSEPVYSGVGLVGVSFQTISANSSILNMDPESNVVTVRWTAPTSGNYSISGYFKGNDTHGNIHPVGISGTAPVFAASITTEADITPFLFAEFLAAGQFIDFNVLAGPDYRYLSTGLSATITADFASTPLPGALPLFAGGLGVMGWLAKRRKRKSAVISPAACL